MVLAAILQAVINHAHAAALAIRSRSVARDLAAFHGELGITPVSYTHLDVYKRQAVDYLNYGDY